MSDGSILHPLDIDNVVDMTILVNCALRDGDRVGKDWRVRHPILLLLCRLFSKEPPNGVRYPLVGGTRQRHFDGTSLKPRKVHKNAATPTSRVHAVLGGFHFLARLLLNSTSIKIFKAELRDLSRK